MEMQTITLLVDEAYEHHSDAQEEHKEFFKSLLPPMNVRDGCSKTPLQEKMLAMVEGALEQDEICGDAGRQFIEFIKGFIDHPTPPKIKDRYSSYKDFMDFRHMDGGMGMAWTMIKCSIGSGVDYKDPKFARITRLAGDHILVSNDIASFDKEFRYYKAGKFPKFPNFPNTQGAMVLKELLALNITASKTMLYAYQFEYEKIIDDELEHLKSIGLTDDEWYLVDAILLAVTGNIIAAATMSRYGGQHSKLSDQSIPSLDSSYFADEGWVGRLSYLMKVGTAVAAVGIWTRLLYSH